MVGCLDDGDAMNAWLGAFALLCGGIAVICGLVVLIRHELDAYRERCRDRDDARDFRRFCKACGGRESAYKVIDAGEQTQDAATDLMMTRGVRLVYRDGRPVNFPPSGDAA